MTTTEVIQAARVRLDDTVAGSNNSYLFSDPVLLRALDNAQREACERAFLIQDTDTAAVCEVAIVAGTHTYAVSPFIIKVMRAKLSNESQPLTQVTKRDLDVSIIGWESTSGTPQWFYQYGNNIRLVYTPEENDTLNLDVYRRPLEEITDLGDALEIPEPLFQGLVHGICAEVYGNQASDTYNPQSMTTEMALFEQWFGPKPSASQLRRRKEVPNNQTARARRF